MKTLKILAGETVQDPFLNTLRKDRAPVTIYLQSGVKLSGVIVRSFDKFVVLVGGPGQDSLIFKHAITTISRLPAKPDQAQTQGSY